MGLWMDWDWDGLKEFALWDSPVSTLSQCNSNTLLVSITLFKSIYYIIIE